MKLLMIIASMSIASMILINCQQSSEIERNENGSPVSKEQIKTVTEFTSVNETFLISNLMDKSNSYGRAGEHGKAALIHKYVLDLRSKFDHHDEMLLSLYEKNRSKTIAVDKDKFFNTLSLELGIDLINYQKYKTTSTKEK